MTLIESWIDSANKEDSHFTVNNLPYGVFSREGEEPRCGVAVGDWILDVAALEAYGHLTIGFEKVFNKPCWNHFMELGEETWSSFRNNLIELLSADGSPKLRNRKDMIEKTVLPMHECQLHLPVQISEYTDFYACRQHAHNVGSMLRGEENALSPNWLHIPIGYNGRASTVVVSGTDLHRPLGQMKPSEADEPVFGPCRRLDFELEIGAIVGESSKMGEPVTLSQADKMIFGYVLLNDWSARDIQAWEYQPLGPFQAKAFATTISPWIVSKQALEPFRCPTPAREKELLPYLNENFPSLYEIDLLISLRPANSEISTTISETNYREMYYSSAQQLCHHAVSGCAMRTGDLLGSGTVSGKDRKSFGSMLELSWGGKEPLTLSEGIQRSFLEDGDHVTFTGFAQGNGYKVGFGSCEGTVLPAATQPIWN